MLGTKTCKGDTLREAALNCLLSYVSTTDKSKMNFMRVPLMAESSAMLARSARYVRSLRSLS